MGEITGFKKYSRLDVTKEETRNRVKHWNEFISLPEDDVLQQQGARCMDCGTPFCHTGCPLGNLIPEFNDAVFQHDWIDAYEILASTNNFPEFTGRICPAPCEHACVLGINQPPVSIENVTLRIF